jgi:hypothetical protein
MLTSKINQYHYGQCLYWNHTIKSEVVYLDFPWVQSLAPNTQGKKKKAEVYIPSF